MLFRSIDGATVTREKLSLENVNFKVRLSAADHWQQQLDTLRIAKLLNEGNPSPVGNFKALFGSRRDPLKPCIITLTDCSMELFHWKVSTERIDYDLNKKQSRFTLAMAQIPLTAIPGYNQGGSKKTFASGRISGFIPVEFQDSTVLVRHAVIMPEKGIKIVFYSRKSTPWFSLNFKGSDVVKNFNASIILNSRNKKLSGLTLNGMSATLLGGTISSTPVSIDPSAKATHLTLKLNNLNLLERVRMTGYFKSSMKGPVSGTIPLTITKNGYSIQNAHLQSSGGGTVTIVDPSKKPALKSEKDAISRFSRLCQSVSFPFGKVSTISLPLLLLSRFFRLNVMVVLLFNDRLSTRSGAVKIK